MSECREELSYRNIRAAFDQYCRMITGHSRKRFQYMQMKEVKPTYSFHWLSTAG